MTDRFPRSSRPGWQILGEMTLPVGSHSDELICTWLTESLASLHLHENFLNKVLKSAQECVSRVLGQDSGMASGHLHLAVLAPNDHTSKGKTWGFFRIEKMGDGEPDQEHPDHTVEFYLYVEGN